MAKTAQSKAKKKSAGTKRTPAQQTTEIGRPAKKAPTKAANAARTASLPAKAKSTRKPSAKTATTGAAKTTPSAATVTKGRGKAPTKAEEQAPAAVLAAAPAPPTANPTGKRGRKRKAVDPARSEVIAAASPAAQGLRERFAALASATGKISGLKRAIGKNFFDVGVLLNQIRDERLYEVKGYGSFEAFVERELDLNKVVCMRSARIAEALDRDAALKAGLDRSSAAVAALDGEDVSGDLPMRSSGGAAFSVIPLHKQ